MRGTALDRYEIVGELGHGGMSVVYRARDRQLSRYVAVKVLHDFLSRQQDARRRFHREAVAVAKLKHPGILEIFDYSGPDADDAFIVTELIEGETLREWVDRRGKPAYPELAALLVAELVRALRHAHEQSVIHRDLKPENVMITRDGGLKLMDFGLAQLMDGGTKLTATGTLLGSPAHMAPEVIDGKPSDARADLFSMGTILYWLAVGRLPFEAPNPSALFKKILDGRYDDPQMIEPRVGNGLSRIIQRALEPDPEKRYQDVTELAADLDFELGAVGLIPAEIHAREFLRHPETFTQELQPKLIAQLTRAGKQALGEGNVARAMDRFNRVLAIDPHHAEVAAEVGRVGRAQHLRRRLRQAAALLAGTLGLTAVGLGAVRTFGPEQTPAHASAAARDPATPSGTDRARLELLPPIIEGETALESGAALGDEAALEGRVAGGAATVTVAGASLDPTPVPEMARGPSAPSDRVGHRTATPTPWRAGPPLGAGQDRLPELEEAGPKPTSASKGSARSAGPSGEQGSVGAKTPGLGASGAQGPGQTPAEAKPPEPGTAGAQAPEQGTSGALRRDASGPTAEPGQVVPTPAREARPPREAKLRIVIGGAVASRLRIDAQAKPFNGYVGWFALAPGEHVIEVQNPAGKQVEVRVRAGEAGDVSEVGPDGSLTRLSDNELRIKITKE